MTIDEAIAALETEFGAQTEMPKPDMTLHLSSGDRIGSPIDAAPTLCLHRSLAAKLWYETARDMLRRTGIESWKLQEKPMMDLWRITIADAKQTHRIAADRFSVVGTIDIKIAPKKAEPVSLPATEEEKSQGDVDGISGRGTGGDAAATDGSFGGSGDDGSRIDPNFAGAGGSDGRDDADRRSAAASAAAGPAVAEADQP